MPNSKASPLQEVLNDLLYQMQAVCFSVAALEDAAQSEKYAGCKLTHKQLTELKEKARDAQKDVFAKMSKKIASLPSDYTTPIAAPKSRRVQG